MTVDRAAPAPGFWGPGDGGPATGSPPLQSPGLGSFRQGACAGVGPDWVRFVRGDPGAVGPEGTPGKRPHGAVGASPTHRGVGFTPTETTPPPRSSSGPLAPARPT